MIKRLFRKLLYSSTGEIDWVKTILINVKCLGLKEGLKLPIFIYQHTDIIDLNCLYIKSEIMRGMVKIGSWRMKSHGNTRLRISGTLIFHGPCEITGGCFIEVEKNGTLEIGKNVKIGESCKIMCANSIILEDYVRFGYEVTLMDTDYHYILDIGKLSTKRNVGIVKIGKSTWISSNVKVMKNSIIPNASIVVGGSLVNKDYSNTEPNTIFVGTPAKPVKNGMRRIINTKVEQRLNDYFSTHPNIHEYCFDNILDIDKFCNENIDARIEN